MMIYHAEVCCIVYTSACFGVGFDVACNIEINGKWLKLCLSYILTFMNGVRCRDRRCAVNKIYFEKKNAQNVFVAKRFSFPTPRILNDLVNNLLFFGDKWLRKML